MRGLFPLRDLYEALRERERGPGQRSVQAASPALVGPQDVLGSGDCWCGEPSDHQWPSKGEGKPHPR